VRFSHALHIFAGRIPTMLQLNLGKVLIRQLGAEKPQAAHGVERSLESDRCAITDVH
jgi:hypothetical protein